MAETLTILTSLAALLLVGIVASMIATKLKLPDVLILILAGMGIAQITYKGAAVVQFPTSFLSAISILALVMIVFHSSSKFKFRELDTFSFKAIRLTVVFLVMCLLFLTIATYLVYRIPVILCLAFAALMAGTSPSTTLSMVKKGKNKIMSFLEIESLVNTPLIVLLPFVILGMWGIEFNVLLTRFVEQISPFLQQIITGVGAGIVLGIIAFEIMRRKYSEKYSPIAIVVIALLTYILAENLGGNGVLSVAVLGLVFGNFHLKEKAAVKTFETVFTDFLQIFVFLLIGLTIKIPFTTEFLISSIYIFAIFILVRWFAVALTTAKEKYTIKEKIFLTLHAPKGIATAVVAFSFATYTFTGITVILDLTLAFIFYSVILATVLTAFKGFFLGKEAVKE